MLITKIEGTVGYFRARAHVREFVKTMLDREGDWWLKLVESPDDLDGDERRWIRHTWQRWAA
jgi:hypothetical protein